MAISEHNRHHLHEAARKTWDDDAAATLMEMLPPVGSADVATKKDLELLEARLKASLLMWIVPTMLTGLGLAAAISRI